MPRVKEEHDLVGIDLLNVPYEDFFQFFNQHALDKLTVTCYCLLVLLLSLSLYIYVSSFIACIYNYPHYIMQIEDH